MWAQHAPARVVFVSDRRFSLNGINVSCRVAELELAQCARVGCRRYKATAIVRYLDN
jgi:hypothetical protein